MGLFQLSSNLGKVIFGLCLVIILWFLGVNMNLSSSSDKAAASKVVPVQRGDISAVNAEIQNNISMSNVKKINNTSDMLSLEMGAKFSLLTEFNGESNVIILEVFDVAQNPKFTQIQGKGPNDSVAVIILTPTLTNILLKTSYNIFEYTGGDFKGILGQVAVLEQRER
jgi:hypothetical protein